MRPLGEWAGRAWHTCAQAAQANHERDLAVLVGEAMMRPRMACLLGESVRHLVHRGAATPEDSGEDSGHADRVDDDHRLCKQLVLAVLGRRAVDREIGVEVVDVHVARAALVEPPVELLAAEGSKYVRGVTRGKTRRRSAVTAILRPSRCTSPPSGG